MSPTLFHIFAIKYYTQNMFSIVEDKYAKENVFFLFIMETHSLSDMIYPQLYG